MRDLQDWLYVELQKGQSESKFKLIKQKSLLKARLLENLNKRKNEYENERWLPW